MELMEFVKFAVLLVIHVKSQMTNIHVHLVKMEKLFSQMEYKKLVFRI